MTRSLSPRLNDSQEFSCASSGCCELVQQLANCGPAIPQLYEEFRALDINGDGVVDLAEVTTTEG